MLKNFRVTAFAISELSRENQQEEGGGVKLAPPPSRLRLNLKKISKDQKSEKSEILQISL